MKKVLVLGKGPLAIKICEWFNNSSEYSLMGVVPVIPEPTWTDSLTDWATSQEIEVVESGKYQDVPQDWSVDLGMSIFYDKIIKKPFINRCKKLINLHNSPLPACRGMRPINWALKDGNEEHGITIHEIEEGIDDGPIISQLKYSIYPDLEEVKDVYTKALDYGYLLFEKTMPLLDVIIPKKQPEGEATYHTAADDDLLGDRLGFVR